MAQELLSALQDAYQRATCMDDMGAIRGAMYEIEKLRATHFRWIPVTTPGQVLAERSFVAYANGDSCVQGKGGRLPEGVTHYLPLPPLPEKSQEERDEKAWLDFCGDSLQYLTLKDFGCAKTAFLAGLKAAREEKK